MYWGAMADSTPSTAGAAATGGASSTAGRLGSSGQDRGTAAVGSTNRGDGKVETRVASTARDAAGAGDAGGQGKGSKPKRARKKGTRELKNERKWAAIMEKLHRPPFKPVKMALIADNRFVIWSAEGAARLRTRCRIVLVPGGFAEPKASWWSMVAVDTTRLCSVPLILGDEEASLCMERGWVELVDAPGGKRSIRRAVASAPLTLRVLHHRCAPDDDRHASEVCCSSGGHGEVAAVQGAAEAQARSCSSGSRRCWRRRRRCPGNWGRSQPQQSRWRRQRQTN